jgi:hypothetical protein
MLGAGGPEPRIVCGRYRCRYGAGCGDGKWQSGTGVSWSLSVLRPFKLNQGFPSWVVPDGSVWTQKPDDSLALGTHIACDSAIWSPKGTLDWRSVVFSS